MLRAVVVVVGLVVLTGCGSAETPSPAAAPPSPEVSVEAAPEVNFAVEDATASGYSNGLQLRRGGDVYGGADGNTFVPEKARALCGNVMDIEILAGGLATTEEREAWLDACVEGLQAI